MRKIKSKMKTNLLAAVMVVGFSIVGWNQSASAGVIVFTGSDEGHTLQSFSTDLRDHLRQGSSLPVLVLGDDLVTAQFVTNVGGIGVTTASSLSGVDLNTAIYSGLYLVTDGVGCCKSDDALIVGFESAINAFLGAGGSFGIRNYSGEATFDPILGTNGGANSSVFGYLGGAGGPINYDDEIVTPDGVSAGFSASNYPAVNQWGHQGYLTSRFAAAGYISLIDAPIYGAGVSALLSLSGPPFPKDAIDAEVPSPPIVMPEPTTLAILGIGLAGLGFARRKRAAYVTGVVRH